MHRGTLSEWTVSRSVSGAFRPCSSLTAFSSFLSSSSHSTAGFFPAARSRTWAIIPSDSLQRPTFLPDAEVRAWNDRLPAYLNY